MEEPFERSPVVEEFRPAGAAAALFEALRNRRGSFLLDSASAAGGLGGWSFIGFDPFLVFRARRGRIELQGEGRSRSYSGSPLHELGSLLTRYRCRPCAGIPFPGGAVGYFSYEFGAELEPSGRGRPGDGSIPDVEFGFYDGTLAFEEATGRAFKVASAESCGAAAGVLQRLDKALAEADCRFAADAPGEGRATSDTASGIEAPRKSVLFPASVENGGPEPKSNFSKTEYVAAVERIRRHIAAGDVYQVNLAQRFELPYAGDPWELYRRLRRRCPEPFACYLNSPSLQILGSSPERFLRIRGRDVETRPIKGTRRRGANPAEDEKLRAELLASEKDRAELLMIVDLERNDLGRVCEFGSVRVSALPEAEAHPTVHHLSANVSGRLRAGLSSLDCVRALFPGGSITGAPKLSAMRLIGEIEPCGRGIYTGAVGYLGFDGGCDFNIAIRTLFCRDGLAWYHAGGGIVWDSDPETEYRECFDKSRAIRAALVEAAAARVASP